MKKQISLSPILCATPGVVVDLPEPTPLRMKEDEDMCVINIGQAFLDFSPHHCISISQNKERKMSKPPVPKINIPVKPVLSYVSSTTEDNISFNRSPTTRSPFSEPRDSLNSWSDNMEHRRSVSSVI